MDRARYPGPSQSHIPPHSNPVSHNQPSHIPPHSNPPPHQPPVHNSARRPSYQSQPPPSSQYDQPGNLARRYEYLKEEIDQLQKLACRSQLNGHSGGFEELQEMGNKYTLFYELSHSLHSHIQHQKKVASQALKLSSDLYLMLEESKKVRFNDEFNGLKNAVEELNNNERMLKTNELKEFYSAPPLNPEILNVEGREPSNGISTKRPTQDVMLRVSRKSREPKSSFKNGNNLQGEFQIDLKESQGQPSPYDHDKFRFSPTGSHPPNNGPLTHSHNSMAPIASAETGPRNVHDIANYVRDGGVNARTEPGAAGLSYLYTLGHGDVVCSIFTSKPDAGLVFTGGLGTIKVWDRHKNIDSAALCLESMDNYIRTSRISPDGKILAVGGESSSIVLWDLTANPPSSLASFVVAAPAVYAIIFSPDSKYMYTCCSNGEVIVWDLVTKKRARTLMGHSMGVTCVDISVDGTKLITGGLDKTVRLWDLIMFQPISCVTLSCAVFSIGLGHPGGLYSEKNCFAVAGLESSMIAVLPLSELISMPQTLAKSYERLQGHTTCVISLRFSPSKDRFISTSKEGLILGWRVNASHLSISRAFTYQESTSVLCSDISQDGTVLATGSGNKLATIYQLRW